MIIAIDGPAASGKGTLGKRLAEHFRLRHLDTGLIYRAVAKALLDAGHPLDDAVRATAAAQALDPAQFDEKTLKGHAIGEAASIVSAIPDVRSALVAFQRDFAAAPPGAVLDGRDIGTVICPSADVKIFVVAAPEERARRRAADPAHTSSKTSQLSDVATALAERDKSDSTRAVSPLAIAPDATVVDTTGVSVEDVIERVLSVIEGRRSIPDNR